MQLPTAVALFLRQLEADGRSPLTIAQYRRHLELLSQWSSSPQGIVTRCQGDEGGVTTDVTAFDHEALARFLTSPAVRNRADGRPRKATSMNVLRSSVRGFFTYLHRAGVLAADPSRLVRRAHCAPPPPRSLSAEERGRLVAALAEDPSFEGQRDRALFTLLLGSGLRLGSALALDVEDLDLAAGEVRVRRAKWGREVVAYLDQDSVEALRQHLQGRADGPVFTSAPGRRLCARQAQRRFGAALGRAGIERPYTPHSLRHAFAQRLYDRTHDLLLVQRALGHRSLSAALAYAQASRQDLRQAVLSAASATAAAGA